MFYSHCLLTKKGGPLKAIWTAAYFHKRLKKDQVSETDIPSSVDEILLNEVNVTYRVLGYLLLGIVRIYSKKVEYLHKECSEVLIKINTFVPPQKASVVKKTMCVQYQSITLPERFELDAFVLDIPDDFSRDSMETNQQISLEETKTSEAAGNEHDTMNQYHQEEMARFRTSSDFCAPLQSLHKELFCFTMDIDTRVNMSSTPLLLEENMERFQNDQLHEEECPDNEMSFRTEEPLNLGAQSTKVHSTSSDFHTPPHNDLYDFTMNVDMGINMSNTPLLEESMEKLQDDQLHEEYPQHEMDCGAEEPLNLGAQSTFIHSEDNQMKVLKITPPDPGDSEVFSEGHPVATTTVGTTEQSKFPHDSGAVIPDMVIKTPASREKRRSSKKRKCVFDNVIVLPNKEFKKNIYDSSSLVVKRRTVPHSALDAWKTCKISNLRQEILEPLIPCSSLRIRDLFYGRSIITPEPAGDAEGAFGFVGDRCKTPCKYLEPEASPVKDTYDCAASVCFVETPTTKESDRARPMTPSTSGGDTMHTFERPDICLTLMDDEVGSREEYNGRQDGLTVRTRKLARNLRDSFLNLKDRGEKNNGLSLEKALEGKTRKESARLFYEILVLKSRGFIDVKQDAPYSNILVESTPQLETI